MTVHPEHAGLCAEVVLNDEPLKEYDDEEANEDRSSETITNYVQVDSAAHFGVRYTLPKGLTGEYGVRSQLLLDGKTVCSSFHHRQAIEQGDVTTCLDKFFTTMNGGNYEQRFRFAQLQIDEDVEGNDYTPQQLKLIGSVTLKLSFIKSVTKRDRTPEPRDAPGAVRKDKLPVLNGVTEKSMKGDAKSHQASLDTPVFTGIHKASRSKTRTIRNCDKPFAIFHFKYRSFAALKSLHIVERTPSPTPTPLTQRAVEVTTRTREGLEAIARISQVKNEPDARKVKQEGRSGFKREADADEVEFISSKRKKTVPSRDDEVIVLD